MITEDDGTEAEGPSDAWSWQPAYMYVPINKQT